MYEEDNTRFFVSLMRTNSFQAREFNSVGVDDGLTGLTEYYRGIDRHSH